MNKIENGEIRNGIFRKYFWYQHPSYLVKDWYKINEAKNELIVNQVNDVLIDLINAVDRKNITENYDKIIELWRESLILINNKRERTWNIIF